MNFCVTFGFLLFSTQAACGNPVIANNGSTVMAILGKDIMLEWTWTSIVNVYSNNVYLDGDKTQGLFDFEVLPYRIMPVVSSYGKTKFGGRLSARYFRILRKFILIIKQARYDDVYSFLYLLQAKNAPSDPKVATDYESETKVSLVRGGPDFCTGKIPKVFSVENATPSINWTTCGVPKTNATWILNQKHLSGGFSKINSNVPYGYDHFITLPKLKPNMCGQRLFLISYGYKHVITGITIHVAFIPGKIKDLTLTRHSNCSYIKWSPLDTGLCPVEYIIELLTNNTVTTRQSNIKFPNTTLCSSNGNVPSQVRVCATYMKKKGQLTTLTLGTVALDTDVKESIEELTLEDIVMICGGTLFIIIVSIVTILTIFTFLQKIKTMKETLIKVSP